MFASFLDNKQELLKKIANKLASQQDLEIDDDEGYDDLEQYSPKHHKSRKRSDVSGGKKIQKEKGR